MNQRFMAAFEKTAHIQLLLYIENIIKRGYLASNSLSVAASVVGNRQT
jgi:hypothetical protein